MKIYKLCFKSKFKEPSGKNYKSKKHKKSPKSHVGKMEGAYHEKDHGKLDTRLTPVHRYTLQQSDFPITVVS